MLIDFRMPTKGKKVPKKPLQAELVLPGETFEFTKLNVALIAFFGLLLTSYGLFIYDTEAFDKISEEYPVLKPLDKYDF